MQKTKLDLVADIVLKYAENNANTLSGTTINQMRQELAIVLYSVDAHHNPVIDVYKELADLGLSPPSLKHCPCCGHPGKYAVSQARFLRPSLVNLYLIVGCPHCGLAVSMFKIGDDLLAACNSAAEKWNRRSHP